MAALKKPSRLLAILISIAVITFIIWQFTGQATTARLRGNQILDVNGKALFIVGVSRPGLEYSCTGVGMYDQASFATMRRWGINTVRLPISSAFWLNTNGTCPTYRTTLDRAIHNAEAAGLYVIVELHHSDHGHEQMPDQDALLFWQQFLPHYRTDPFLMVELFNEPHDVSWAVWHDGGTVQTASSAYVSVGMQQLVDVANTLAPHTLVIVSGLAWEYDFSGMLPNFVLKGNNLIYGVHLYNFPGKQPQDWANAFGFLESRHPVLITEFGDTSQCDGSWLRNSLLQMRAQSAGMIAWAWIVDVDPCHYPALLADWSGSPSTYGQTVYDFYLREFATPHQ